MITGKPAEGTKQKGILDLLMTDYGTTTRQVIEHGYAKSSSNFSNAMHQLTERYGFDIRIIGRIGRKTGRSMLIYKVVGRYNPDGSYEQFTDMYPTKRRFLREY